MQGDKAAATAARLAKEYALNVHPDAAPAYGRTATLIADLEVDLCVHVPSPVCE